MNHLVRADEDRLRNREPEGLGSLEVDDQLELRRPPHGEIGAPSTYPDFVHEHYGALEGRAGIIDLLEQRRIFKAVAERNLSKALLHPIEDLAGGLKYLA
jgi:hypothetical protein